MPVYIKNKRAYRNYEILDKTEAGIKLMGSEVKSIKEGKGTLTGAYVKPSGNSLWLIGLHVPPYSKSGRTDDYDPTRTRQLLLKKREVEFLRSKTEQKGLTLIPLKIYTKGDLLKVSVGVGRGLKKANKKQQIISKQETMDAKREIKDSARR